MARPLPIEKFRITVTTYRGDALPRVQIAHALSNQCETSEWDEAKRRADKLIELISFAPAHEHYQTVGFVSIVNVDDGGDVVYHRAF